MFFQLDTIEPIEKMRLWSTFTYVCTGEFRHNGEFFDTLYGNFLRSSETRFAFGLCRTSSATPSTVSSDMVMKVGCCGFAKARSEHRDNREWITGRVF
jgi:hypothetical protein